MQKTLRNSLTSAVLLAVSVAACGCGETGSGASSPSDERLASAELVAVQPERDRGGRFRGPPQPGQILPPFLQERLDLTEEQKTRVEALQKEADGKLEKILTAEQKKQLQEMREGQGPGGPPPGGRPEQF